MAIDAQLSVLEPKIRQASRALQSERVRYVVGVLALAAAYYGTAKLAQSLRYTASVSAVWPPAGVGIAALYLWGLRWWPGVLIAESIVNAELLGGGLPLGSLIGQQLGNMAEVVGGAVFLTVLVGRRVRLDRAQQVGGVFIALALATAISATVGTVSMLAGGVIDLSQVATFWRTWWLGDFAGSLIVVPLALAWAADPRAAWRRLATSEGALLIIAVVVLSFLAVTNDHPVTYMVFPALIWAAFRFGPAGATLAVAIAAGVAIGVTAHDVGPFFKQAIDDRTLSTQIYIAVAALTTLCLSAVVRERELSARALVEAKRREGDLADEERQRIARDLHDSVSQALFSTLLQTRTAQKALAQSGASPSASVARALNAIGELTKTAQSEMRALIFELGRDPVESGLVAALNKHAWGLGSRDGPAVHIDGPEKRLALTSRAETQLYRISREAIANVLKHAGAKNAWVRIAAERDRVVVEIRDDGRGFDTSAPRPGHFGLESMRSRADEIDAVIGITSTPESGTLVRIVAPVGRANGN